MEIFVPLVSVGTVCLGIFACQLALTFIGNLANYALMLLSLKKNDGTETSSK